MRTESITVEAFVIYEALRAPGRGVIDPITVTLRDVGGGGQIIVACFGETWAHWFGAIGSQTLRDFIADTSPDYLTSKLAWGKPRKPTKREESYVQDIARAVIESLKGGSA